MQKPSYYFPAVNPQTFAQNSSHVRAQQPISSQISPLQTVNSEPFASFPQRVFMNGGYGSNFPHFAIQDRTAMSDIGPLRRKERTATKKRTRADLTKAMDYFGINTSESARFTLVSGGGDFDEKEELRKSQKKELEKNPLLELAISPETDSQSASSLPTPISQSSTDTPISETSEKAKTESKSENGGADKRKLTPNEKQNSDKRKTSKKSHQQSKEMVKRRMVYWIEPGVEIGYYDVSDGSSLSYISLQKTEVISNARIGLARYFACTDNVHTSKFVELMLVRQVESAYTLRTIQQISFPFAPARKFITVYIGGDRRYFRGLPEHSLPASLGDGHSMTAFVEQTRTEKGRRIPRVPLQDDKSASSGSSFKNNLDVSDGYSIGSIESYDEQLSSQALERFNSFSLFSQQNPNHFQYQPNPNFQLRNQQFSNDTMMQQIASLSVPNQPVILSQQQNNQMSQQPALKMNMNNFALLGINQDLTADKINLFNLIQQYKSALAKQQQQLEEQERILQQINKQSQPSNPVQINPRFEEQMLIENEDMFEPLPSTANAPIWPQKDKNPNSKTNNNEI